MNQTDGVIFSIAEDNSPVSGCTVSKSIHDSKDFGITYFTMTEDTDISAESYAYHKILIAACGELAVYSCGHESILHHGEAFITPAAVPVRGRTHTGGRPSREHGHHQ